MEKLGGLGGKKGNTRKPSSTQAPKRKNHFFTWNNHTDSTGDFLDSEFRRLGAIKFIFQEEIAPTTGTPHLQGMVMFPKEIRSTVWDKEGHGHYERLKFTDGEYQTKEETRKPNGKQWSYGFPKPIKIITELKPWQSKIEQIYLTEPDNRTVYWFWESEGNIGKSVFCKYMVVKHRALFCSGGKYTDIMNLVFNQDMDNCRGVIFDIPRAHKGAISYASLESIKNGMVCNTKYETGVKVFNSPHVIIFANFPPETPEECSADRWKIFELTDKKRDNNIKEFIEKHF